MAGRFSRKRIIVPNNLYDIQRYKDIFEQTKIEMQAFKNDYYKHGSLMVMKEREEYCYLTCK